MIGIFLSVLKIIGIILLCILCFILFLILLILFVPVRYHFQGIYYDRPQGSVRISWLLHILSVNIQYLETLTVRIRILGVPLDIFRRKKRTKPKKEDVSPKETVPEKAIAHTAEIADTEGKASEEKKETAFSAAQTDADTTSKQQTNTSKENRAKALWHRIIRYYKRFIATCKNAYANISYYVTLLQRDTTKLAFTTARKRIFKLIRYILPTKGCIDIVYGMEDPAVTANILALHGMLYPVLGDIIYLHPDFEKPVFQAKMHGKGRIASYYIIYQLLWLIMDKNCRTFIQLLKKESRNERE